MASEPEVLKDAHVTINDVNLSDLVISITLPLSTAEIDKTCMGADSTARLPGLKGASLSIKFAQDFASGKVDATLWAVYNGGVAVAVKVRKSATDSIGAANPEYQFNVIMSDYTAIDGSVGDLSGASAEFLSDGDVTRATA